MNCGACGNTGLVMDVTDTDRGDELREVACAECEDRAFEDAYDDELAMYADRANDEDAAMPDCLDEECCGDED